MPEGSGICLNRGASEKTNLISYYGYIHELFYFATSIQYIGHFRGALTIHTAML